MVSSPSGRSVQSQSAVLPATISSVGFGGSRKWSAFGDGRTDCCKSRVDPATGTGSRRWFGSWPRDLQMTTNELANFQILALVPQSILQSVSLFLLYSVRCFLRRTIPTSFQDSSHSALTFVCTSFFKLWFLPSLGYLFFCSYIVVNSHNFKNGVLRTSSNFRKTWWNRFHQSRKHHLQNRVKLH